MTRDNQYIPKSPMKDKSFNRSVSARKGGRVTPTNRSNFDISIDNEYLEKVDAMEEENKGF